MNTTKPTRCALYARVSTDDQTCQMQLDELRQYVDRRGWIIHAEYVDTGWSGSKKDRPQLSKLMRDARAHRFDAVLVWKVDRFGRSVANFTEAVQELKSWDIRFMAITQSVDTGDENPASKLLMQILVAVSEFEREMIVERVKAGLAAARRRGVRLGRKPQVIDKTKVMQLHLRGKSIRAIATELKLQKDLVHKIVRSAA